LRAAVKNCRPLSILEFASTIFSLFCFEIDLSVRPFWDRYFRSLSEVEVTKWPFDLPGQAQGPILSVTERSRGDQMALRPARGQAQGPILSVTERSRGDQMALRPARAGSGADSFGH